MLLLLRVLRFASDVPRSCVACGPTLLEWHLPRSPHPFKAQRTKPLCNERVLYHADSARPTEEVGRDGTSNKYCIDSQASGSL